VFFTDDVTGTKPNRLHLGLEWDEVTALNAIPSPKGGGGPKPRSAYWLELELRGAYRSFSELPLYLMNGDGEGNSFATV